MEGQAECPNSQDLAGDASLVWSALNGKRTSFEALVRRHQRSVLATCLAVLRDRQLAEDAAQDAFLAAYRALKSLRDPSSFGGWLLSIARNRASRLARQRTRGNKVVRDYADGAEQMTDAEQAFQDEALLAALGALPDHERSVVVLRYFDGHAVADIAAIVGRPVGTVTKQLQRAHDRLRRALKEPS